MPVQGANVSRAVTRVSGGGSTARDVAHGQDLDGERTGTTAAMASAAEELERTGSPTRRRVRR
jgi:hypothetical protein